MTVMSQFNFIGAMTEKPVIYRSEPPPGKPQRNLVIDKRFIEVHDARELEPRLDTNGFELISFLPKQNTFTDTKQIETNYYSEVRELLKATLSANRVFPFDHNVRNTDDSTADGGQKPVFMVHNDYTTESAPIRAQTILGDDFKTFKDRRLAIVNVWRPIQETVKKSPLAICDFQSLNQKEFVDADFVFKDRIGKVCYARYHESMKWYYFPNLQPDEAILIKCYDSNSQVSHYSAHSAFCLPDTDENTPPRKSIEVRGLVFF